MPSCNFRCPYCHNHPIVLAPKKIPGISLENVLERISKYKDWIDGIVISGGEPTLQTNLPQMITVIKKEGFLVKLDTNGSNPDMLARLLEANLLDYVAMDVKAPMDELRYRRVAGGIHVDIAGIRKSCNILLASTINYEFRTTVCPALLNQNDCEDIFKQLNGAKKLVLQNFNPTTTLDPDLEKLAPLSSHDMHTLGELARNWVQECKVVC